MHPRNSIWRKSVAAYGEPKRRNRPPVPFQFGVSGTACDLIPTPGFGDLRVLLDQWIGFFWNILPGNHWCFNEDHGAFRFQFSLKPIYWLESWVRFFSFWLSAYVTSSARDSQSSCASPASLALGRELLSETLFINSGIIKTSKIFQV